MFSIMKNFPKFLAVSLLIMIAGLVAFIMNGGFKTDIDFSGGTMLQINMEKDYEIADVEALIKETTGIAPDTVQKASDANAQYQALIKMAPLDSDGRTNLYNAIKDKFGLTLDLESSLLSSDNFSPLLSSEILNNALLATILATILILIYITIRFTFASAIAGIAALIHDTLIMLAVYAIFKIPVNSSFVAAILTIIGYSINDTIIVFDRIRENNRFAKNTPFVDICEKSIWQTMRRSLNTTGTVVVSLIILQIMGSESIRQFSGPLIVGSIAGSYSTMFLATPIWNAIGSDLKGSKNKKKKHA